MSMCESKDIDTHTHCFFLKKPERIALENEPSVRRTSGPSYTIPNRSRKESFLAT